MSRHWKSNHNNNVGIAVVGQQGTTAKDELIQIAVGITIIGLLGMPAEDDLA
jgi:hypothetical protein